MKSLRCLIFAVLLLPLPCWAQGVRMSADFLPLEVGKHWTYDVTNVAGQKVGQIAFAVEEYTIVEGTSFYVLSEFPFSTEAGDPIRFVRYDRSERFFIRKSRNNEGPLFLDDGAVTEVVEADSSGAPQKFVLRMDKMALTFQRGVGIVEAKMEKGGTSVIAKLIDATSKSSAAPNVAPGPTAVPTTKDMVLIPPPVPTTRREPPVATVTSQNPRIEVLISPSPNGYQIAMAVLNSSDKLLPFKFNSGQTYDFMIQDVASSKEVWRWSNDNFFTQVQRSDSIRPEGKWQFEVTWNKKDNDGKLVPPGKYRLIGVVMSVPNLQASPVLFDLR
jgi:Intracellular proteinase inhibitor